MLADALGGKGDGGERVFDLVSYALRHFFPCQLPLSAQQFGRVFNDQDGSRPGGSQIEARAGDGQVHGAAFDVDFNFGGGSAHALASAHDAGDIVRAVGGHEGGDVLAAQLAVFAQAHENREGAIGLEHGAGAIERNHSGGYGFNNGL